MCIAGREAPCPHFSPDHRNWGASSCFRLKVSFSPFLNEILFLFLGFQLPCQALFTTVKLALMDEHIAPATTGTGNLVVISYFRILSISSHIFTFLLYLKAFVNTNYIMDIRSLSCPWHLLSSFSLGFHRHTTYSLLSS